MRRLTPLAIVAIVAGIALAVVAVLYFAVGASDLPSFFPGHQGNVNGTHPKRGVAAAVIALVCFAYAWMTTRSTSRR